jgi:uncharacterized protein (UPF0303 family)
VTDSPLPTVDELRELDHAVDFERFGHADAWEVGQRVVTLAKERNVSVTAAIWLGEQRVFHVGMPGTSADNDQWMERKAALVRRYDASSWLTTQRLRAYGITEALPLLGLDPRLHALSGGGFPIRVRGTMVGVAVVSGVDDQTDHDICVAALRAQLTPA